MITLNRLLAHQLRAIFRRALRLAPRETSHPVLLSAAPDGVRIQARSATIAVEYHLPGNYPAEQLRLPLAFLVDCEGRKAEPVELESQPDGRTLVKWRDASVPQMVRYEAVASAESDDFPALPAQFSENPPRLLAALQAASQTTDPDSARYALGAIQLRGGSGAIAATDGRQLLVQSGFAFPWEDDLLVPGIAVFGSAELGQQSPVLVGKAGDWVFLKARPWTIGLALHKDGRFPKIDHHIPRAKDASTRLTLAPSDAEFLSRSLAKLPCEETHNWPLTLELNGEVAVRGRGEHQSQPTELILSGSKYGGDQVRININRQYLARAVALGFRELCLYGPKGPILGRDDQRSYLWMPLDPESAIKPAADAVRIVSPERNSRPSHARPQQERSKTVRKAANRSPREARKQATCADRREPADLKEGEDLTQRAIEVHASLRQAIGALSGLVQSLKRQRKRTRTMRSALESLRQLEEAAR